MGRLWNFVRAIGEADTVSDVDCSVPRACGASTGDSGVERIEWGQTRLASTNFGSSMASFATSVAGLYRSNHSINSSNAVRWQTDGKFRRRLNLLRPEHVDVNGFTAESTKLDRLSLTSEIPDEHAHPSRLVQSQPDGCEVV